MKKIIALVFGIVLIGMCGGLGVYTLNHTTDPVAPASERITLGSGPSPVTRASKEIRVSGQIDEGTWEVGTDVKPGKYRSTGAVPSTITMCTWTVKNAAGDYVGGSLTDKNNAPQLVTLAKGQVFETAGCHPWSPR